MGCHLQVAVRSSRSKRRLLPAEAASNSPWAQVEFACCFHFLPPKAEATDEDEDEEEDQEEATKRVGVYAIIQLASEHLHKQFSSKKKAAEFISLRNDSTQKEEGAIISSKEDAAGSDFICPI